MQGKIAPKKSPDSRETKLTEFVAWTTKNITGDEKGQAQIYLDRLFQAFGHAGVLDVGGQPEFRIRKDSEDGGGTAFADLVWKPVVLIEMKRRGADLRKHYRQAFDYWVRCVPNRPRYVVLCNFDEFSVYDFETQIDTPGDALQVFLLEDDYSFGILQSSVHWLWFVTKCSKMKSDFRYTPDTVFDTFPWPQSPTTKQVAAVAEAGRVVRRERMEMLKKVKGGLRELYRLLELPGENPLKDAHAALDEAVLAAYGFSARKDLLSQIGALNLDVAARLGRGEAVIAPGVPASYSEIKKLVTEDCVKALESI